MIKASLWMRQNRLRRAIELGSVKVKLVFFFIPVCYVMDGNILNMTHYLFHTCQGIINPSFYETNCILCVERCARQSVFFSSLLCSTMGENTQLE